MRRKLLLVAVLVTFSPVLCQENAGYGVASSLMDCYNDSAIPGILTANGRPPATINILIEYIRKLEDANPTMSAQQMSLQIMQRFRQDGIRRSARNMDSQFGIPFSPLNFEFYKNRVLLTNLLPNVQQTLNTGDLNDLERCSLHYLVSSTTNKTVRGDEDTVCSRTSRYTSRIMTRRRRDAELVSHSPDDFGVLSIETLNSNQVSQCPLELGVVFTNYGTIKAGNTLAGIATGMNQQNYLTNIDNRFAGTVAGEITEAALYQSKDPVDIGAAGGWNSTINPRYFFLQTNNFLQATDAEIRGALDGLIMALQMTSWRSTFSDIKVSQILDMYYSPHQKGVFDNSFRACNRNVLYTEVSSTEMMTNQVLFFMPVLYQASLFGTTLSNSSFATFSQAGVTAFNNYLPQMNSSVLSCNPTDTNIERVAADLLIFLDTSWAYTTVQPILSYVLDNIDVNRFGTVYTLFSASSNTNITTNRTSFLADFHQQYNLSIHQRETNGFDYIRVFEAIENITRVKLENTSYTGGDSTVVLLIPRTVLNEEQRTFVTQRRDVMRQFAPDLNIFVLGTGTQDDYSSIVTNPSQDVVILSESTSEEVLKGVGQQVVNSIRNVPRAVVNPSCGPTFTGGSNSFSLIQNVDLQGVNYYRISPNYFYDGGDTRNLRIREMSTGTITVCISRDQSRPDNLTSTCETVRRAERTFDIRNFCDGNSVSTCSPIFMSVFGTLADTNCRDTSCRFPNDIRYTISMDNVGCASGSMQHIASITLIILLSVILSF